MATANENKTQEPEHFGLTLTLGNAPATPHRVEGVPGYFHPDRATPVGAPGEVTLEQAKELSEDPNTHLQLVEVSANEVDELRKLAVEHIEQARHGVRQHRGLVASGIERAHVRDEQTHASKS